MRNAKERDLGHLTLDDTNEKSADWAGTIEIGPGCCKEDSAAQKEVLWQRVVSPINEEVKIRTIWQ